MINAVSDIPTNLSPFRIAVLLIPNFSNLTLGSVIEPLRVANRMSPSRLYDWQIYGERSRTVHSSSGLTIAVDADLAEAGDFDAVFILASEKAERNLSKDIARFLRAARRRKKMICGFDAAAYHLAYSGILEGAKATTHWEDLEDFQERFPRIDVVPDRFVTDGWISTTSGSLPSLDFTLDLIRRQQGLALAMTVSGMFIYDKETPGLERQRMVAVSRLAGAAPKLAGAIRIMEENLAPPLQIAEISKRIGLSERHLARMFREKLKTSPAQFYLSLRLDVGRRLLETTNRSIVDIAVASGFESRTGFTRAFVRQFNSTPSATRRG